MIKQKLMDFERNYEKKKEEEKNCINGKKKEGTSLK